MKANLPRGVAVVGLGYVGLPLASAFGKVVPTVGFDINEQRVRELRKGADRNGEVGKAELREPLLELTSDPTLLQRASVIIIAVPTPVDKAKRPDLSHLVDASRLVARNLTRGATVVYESTVYPGCTEETCIPVLEAESGLKAGRDFKVGYSPERINPGDGANDIQKHRMRPVKNPFGTKEKFDAVVLAVPHRMFLDMPPEAYTALLRNGGRPAVFVDIKGAYRDAGNKSGVIYWSL